MHEHYSLLPYLTGNSVVDVLLWALYCVLFGIFFTWGTKVGNKLP